jgi:hypothetical protein
VSFAAIILCVASQRMFIVVYFVMTQSGKFWIHPRIFCCYFACQLTEVSITYTAMTVKWHQEMDFPVSEFVLCISLRDLRFSRRSRFKLRPSVLRHSASYPITTQWRHNPEDRYLYLLYRSEGLKNQGHLR